MEQALLDSINFYLKWGRPANRASTPELMIAEAERLTGIKADRVVLAFYQERLAMLCKPRQPGEDRDHNPASATGNR